MTDRDNLNPPNETISDKIANAFDGHDDPNRGPLDRLKNAIDGNDAMWRKGGRHVDLELISPIQGHSSELRQRI